MKGTVYAMLMAIIIESIYLIVEIEQGSRLGFNHLSLRDATAKNTALDSIRNLSQQINFGQDANPPFPVVYTYIYVEWESNKVLASQTPLNCRQFT